MSINPFDRIMRTLALYQELDTPHYKAFVLRNVERSTRIDSCRIIFTPDGIVICGDLCPGDGNNGGLVSDLGYGLGWFAGELGSDYLCSKFLRQKFVPQLAMKEIESWVDAINDRRYDAEDKVSEIEDGEGDDMFSACLDDSNAQERIDALEDIIYKLDCNEMGEHGLHEALGDLDCDYVCEGVPGYGYEPRDENLLSAIQRRFAYLYKHDLRQRFLPDGEKRF